MVNVDFDAVVKTVPMPGKGIDEKVRSLVTSDRVFFFENGKKVIFELGWAVGKVEGDNEFGKSRCNPTLYRSSLLDLVI